MDNLMYIYCPCNGGLSCHMPICSGTHRKSIYEAYQQLLVKHKCPLLCS
jgi:CDGSH-type Zn-finger protein